MSAETQSTIIGEPSGEYIEIETNGRIIRPLLALPDALVDEMRVHFDEDGFHIEHVDPANVGLIDMTVPASAFDRYELHAEDTLSVGLNLDELKKHLRDARMGKRTKDEVSLKFDGTHTRVSIMRDYAQTEVTRRDQFLNIDPDAIRESPGKPGVTPSWRSIIDVDAFKDTLEHINAVRDHVVVSERNGRLVMSGMETDDDGDTLNASEADFGEIAEENRDDPNEDAVSKFSLDYMLAFAKALKKAKVEQVTFKWDDEFPMILQFERQDSEGETVYEGMYFAAPRIHE